MIDDLKKLYVEFTVRHNEQRDQPLVKFIEAIYYAIKDIYSKLPKESEPLSEYISLENFCEKYPICGKSTMQQIIRNNGQFEIECCKRINKIKVLISPEKAIKYILKNEKYIRQANKIKNNNNYGIILDEQTDN
jgi:hypothetical protein